MKRTVYIKDDIWKQVRKAAIDKGTSASGLIEEALLAWLAKAPEKSQAA